jgi:hypothetical protein
MTVVARKQQVASKVVKVAEEKKKTHQVAGIR